MPKDALFENHDHFIDVRTVARILDVSVATVHRLRKTADFPKARTISERCVRWRRSQIEEWSESRTWCFETEFALQ